jgi:hypothetical protein
MNIDAGALAGAANAEPDPPADEIIAGSLP